MPSPIVTPACWLVGRHRGGRSPRRASSRAGAPMMSPFGGGPDDVAEHRAGLDRRELARVADEDQPRIGRTASTSRAMSESETIERLVDDHDVVGQPLAAVVAEAAVAAWAPAEEPVERRGLQPEKLGADRVVDGQLRLPPRAPPPRAARRPCRSGRRARRAAAATRVCAACSASSATIRATVVVLPVPGPPATTASRRSTADAAARH